MKTGLKVELFWINQTFYICRKSGNIRYGIVMQPIGAPPDWADIVNFED